MTIKAEDERTGELVLDQFRPADPEFTLIMGRYFAGLAGVSNALASTLGNFLFAKGAGIFDREKPGEI